MRAVLLALLLCAACGSRDAYPPDVVENFMRACTERAQRNVCRCALDAIERRFTLEDFRTVEAHMRAGQMPKALVDAVRDCAP